MRNLGWIWCVCLVMVVGMWPVNGQANTEKVRPEEVVAQQFKAARTAVETDPKKGYALAKELELPSLVEDVQHQLVARAALESGELSAAVEALVKLGKTTPSKSVRQWAELDRAEALWQLGREAEARTLAKTLRGQKLSMRTVERRFYLSRLARLEHDMAASGDPKSKIAKARARELLTRYPSEKATLREGLVLSVEDLSEADRYARAQGLFESWDYVGARAEYERFVEHAKYGGQARWHLADIALNRLRDRPKEAEKLFAELAKTGPKKESSLYMLARAQMRQERYDDALKTMDRYLAAYPKGTHVGDVHYYRGWLPYDHRHDERAIEGFKKYVKRYGKRGRYSSYVYGFWAWAHMRQGQWKEAIDVYEQMGSFGNTLVEGKALYWQAHAYDQLGDKKNALAKLDRLRRRYSLSYYGVLGEQLRAKIEGTSQLASKVWWPDGGGSADDTPRKSIDALPVSKLSAADRRVWERVKLLVLLDERERARESLSPIYDKIIAGIPKADRDLWVHAIGYYVGDYHRMWRLATGGSISAMPSAPDPDALRSVMAYPRAYKDVVLETTGEFKLPPELMWSIMRQESRYKPGAVSHTDAVGALQMIPATARLVAAELGVTYDVRTFFRPEVGFRYSAFYMRKLLDTYEGLFVPMASSYNTGPGPIARWFRKNPDASFPWLIEEFEYNEGRNYGRKVAEHMLRYLYLYEADAKRRGEILDKMFPLDRNINLPEDVGY